MTVICSHCNKGLDDNMAGHVCPRCGDGIGTVVLQAAPTEGGWPPMPATGPVPAHSDPERYADEMEARAAERGSYADHARQFPDADSEGRPLLFHALAAPLPPSLAEWLAEAQRLALYPKEGRLLANQTLQHHLDALPGIVAEHIAEQVAALTEGRVDPDYEAALAEWQKGEQP